MVFLKSPHIWRIRSCYKMNLQCMKTSSRPVCSKFSLVSGFMRIEQIILIRARYSTGGIIGRTKRNISVGQCEIICRVMLTAINLQHEISKFATPGIQLFSEIQVWGDQPSPACRILPVSVTLSRLSSYLCCCIHSHSLTDDASFRKS